MEKDFIIFFSNALSPFESDRKYSRSITEPFEVKLLLCAYLLISLYNFGKDCGEDYMFDKAIPTIESQDQDNLEVLVIGIEIKWIEKLLQTPVDDYRKNAMALILAPYLLNIKKLTYDDAFNIINEWLSYLN